MITVPINENGIPLEPTPYDRPTIIVGSQKIMLVFDNMEEYLNFMNPPQPDQPIENTE
jgi:hypothetical protein